MTATTEPTTRTTITVLHRIAAVLHLLDNLPASARWVEIDDVRRLLVGDLDRPQYTVVPAAELAWLRGVHLAAEVAALSASPEHQRSALAGLRNQLDREPKAGAR